MNRLIFSFQSPCRSITPLTVKVVRHLIEMLVDLSDRFGYRTVAALLLKPFKTRLHAIGDKTKLLFGVFKVGFMLRLDVGDLLVLLRVVQNKLICLVVILAYDCNSRY